MRRKHGTHSTEIASVYRLTYLSGPTTRRSRFVHHMRPAVRPVSTRFVTIANTKPMRESALCAPGARMSLE